MTGRSERIIPMGKYIYKCGAELECVVGIGISVINSRTACPINGIRNEALCCGLGIDNSATFRFRPNRNQAVKWCEKQIA